MTHGNVAMMALGFLGAFVVLAEGIIVNGFLNSAVRQPEMESLLFARMLIGIAFVEGTFFITLAMTFVL